MASSCARASAAAAAGTSRRGRRQPSAASSSDAAQRCLRALLGVDRCREELAACLTAGSDEVIWVTGGERPALHSAPLDVSQVMSAQVFSVMPVVMTSATLPRGLAARIGAPEHVTKELDVGSPFAYKANALLYCAVALPDRRRPEAEAAIHDEIEALVLAAGGRTLALFTSRRAMTVAAEVLAARLPWPVMVQGELPKAALLEALSSQSAACLFATMSFWQGVDVPGPALSLVVIDRIPFPRPDDPLMAARRDAAGRAGFQTVDLPRAATLARPGRRAPHPDRDRPGSRRRARSAARAGLLRADAGQGPPSDAKDQGKGGGRSLPSRPPCRGRGRAKT